MRKDGDVSEGRMPESMALIAEMLNVSYLHSSSESNGSLPEVKGGRSRLLSPPILYSRFANRGRVEESKEELEQLRDCQALQTQKCKGDQEVVALIVSRPYGMPTRSPHNRSLTTGKTDIQRRRIDYRHFGR